MRKIILSINTTLDGFISGLNGEMDWHFPYWDEEMSASWNRQLLDADTILLGRRTYVAFAAHWSGKKYGFAMARQDIMLAEMMNNYTKAVVSNTLNFLPWVNSRLIKGDVLDDIRKLKNQPGRHIVIFGSACLAALLVQHDLIDEYILWVHPVKINRGERLAGLSVHDLCLKLTAVEQFASGVTRCSYARIENLTVGH